MVQSRTQLQPPDGVTVVPYLTHQQLREAYERASVVAIATRPNLHASGMTVSLEAMSVGRPVVITETPGLDDYVRDGDTGFLVPCNDHRALAARIGTLLEDHAAAEAMGNGLADESSATSPPRRWLMSSRSSRPHPAAPGDGKRR